MSQGPERDVAPERKKRVQRLKKLIVVVLVISIVVPNLFCIYLYKQNQVVIGQLLGMNEKMQVLTQELEESRNLYTQILEEQREPEEEEVVEEEVVEEIVDPYASYKHKVYLTFDDGPSDNTEAILDVLDAYNVKATFFVVGKDDERSKERMKEIVDRGHTIAMHSYSHKYKEIYKSMYAFSQDFQILKKLILDATGVDCKYYRFPGGSSNTVSAVDMIEFANYLEQQNVVFYDWNVSSQDAEGKSASVNSIIRNSTKDLEQKAEAMILFHDANGKNTTVEALPKVIEKIQEMEDTIILPITDLTHPIQHIHTSEE